MVLDERILVIFEVIALALAGLLEFGFNTISLLEGRIRFVHCNLHVRMVPSGCIAWKRELAECEFLQGLSVGLREEEECDQDLDGSPDAIGDVILPSDVLQTDGVYELVEETNGTATSLEDHYTPCTDVVWEQLNQEGYNPLEPTRPEQGANTHCGSRRRRPFQRREDKGRSLQWWHEKPQLIQRWRTAHW